MQGIEEVREILRADDPEGRITSLAALVRVAIEDGRAMLKREDVNPHYSNWLTVTREYVDDGGIRTHEPRCTVCLAGGILLGTRSYKIEGDPLCRRETPDRQPRHVRKAMMALECVRQESYLMAYEHLGMVPRWGTRDDSPDERAANDERRTVWAGAVLEVMRPHQVPFEARLFTSAGRFSELLDELDRIADTLAEFEVVWC